MAHGEHTHTLTRTVTRGLWWPLPAHTRLVLCIRKRIDRCSYMATKDAHFVMLVGPPKDSKHIKAIDKFDKFIVLMSLRSWDSEGLRSEQFVEKRFTHACYWWSGQAGIRHCFGKITTCVADIVVVHKKITWSRHLDALVNVDTPGEKVTNFSFKVLGKGHKCYKSYFCSATPTDHT